MKSKMLAIIFYFSTAIIYLLYYVLGIYELSVLVFAYMFAVPTIMVLELLVERIYKYEP